MESSLLQDQARGLRARLSDLRGLEKTHIKAATLAEQIEKARTDIDALNAKLEKAKEKRQELKDKKRDALRASCGALANAITALLPAGEAVVELDEHLFIGWRKSNGRLAPYAGLSGGERVLFDAALCNAMLGDSANKILVMECGEVDQANLKAVLERVAKDHPGAQLLVNTWADVEEAPEGWEVKRL